MADLIINCPRCNVLVKICQEQLLGFHGLCCPVVTCGSLLDRRGSMASRRRSHPKGASEPGLAGGLAERVPTEEDLRFLEQMKVGWESGQGAERENA